MPVVMRCSQALWEARCLLRDLAGLLFGLMSLAGMVLLSGCDATEESLATEWVLPERTTSARSASELVQAWLELDLEEREEAAVAEILTGNVPSWLRELRQISFSVPETDGEWVEVRLGVLPDYVAVGSNDDFLWLPLSPQAAQRIADATDMSLPTHRLIDTIWQQAEVRVEPRPIPPSAAMTTLSVFVDHARKLNAQRDSLGIQPGDWVAGHKKDVVLSGKLNGADGKVAIYGWHRSDGSPIQPVYTGHTDRWVDYSHGVRLVTRSVRIDKRQADLASLLKDLRQSRWFDDDGPMDRTEYLIPTG